MQKILLLALAFYSFAHLQHTKAQSLQVTGGITPEELLQNFLGGGITVSNVTFQMSPQAYGKFVSPSPLFQIDSGFVMTTGSINNVTGPNNFVTNQQENGGTGNNLPGDPALDTLWMYQTQDASILEFDFVANSDKIQFDYIFGSEEYPNYAPPINPEPFNDRFAFFLSGPGVSPQNQNVALVPGVLPPTGVGLMSVNPANNTQNYRSNTEPGPLSQITDYNGITRRLTAEYSGLIPCATYHFRFSIADGGDGLFDSGVFLAANSFKSVGQPPSMTVTGTDVTVNGGQDGSISISVTGGSPPYQYSIGGAFADSPNFTNLAAGTYFITVKDANGCTLNDNYTINEPPSCFNLPVLTQITNVSCTNQTDGKIVVNMVVGTPPYQYSLNDSPFTPNPVFESLTAGTYTIKVVDSNNCTGAATVQVTQPGRILRFMTLVKSTYVCPGCFTGKIIAGAIGGTTPYSFSLNGQDWQSSGIFSGLSAGVYMVYIRDASGCTINKIVVIAG